MATIDLGRVVGPQGPQGERGPAGPTGAQGPAGAQGPKGAPGAGTGANLLDNWYFADPINQRGKTGYEGSGYTIDRWKQSYDASKTTLVPGAGITFHAGKKWLTQEKEMPGLTGQTLTASALLGDGQLLSGSVALAADWTTAVMINGYDRLELRYENGRLGTRIVNYGTGPAQFTVVALKVELGDHQTLCRQDAGGGWALNDPPPDRALELARCQRYYQRYDKAGFCGVAYLRNKIAYLFIPTPITMRANPAVTVSGQFDTYTSAGESVETTMTCSGSGKLSDNGVTVRLVTTSDAFQAAVSLFAPYDDGLIELSAEL